MASRSRIMIRSMLGQPAPAARLDHEMSGACHGVDSIIADVLRVIIDTDKVTDHFRPGIHSPAVAVDLALPWNA